jgi:hypothetical protein
MQALFNYIDTYSMGEVAIVMFVLAITLLAITEARRP